MKRRRASGRQAAPRRHPGGQAGGRQDRRRRPVPVHVPQVVQPIIGGIEGLVPIETAAKFLGVKKSWLYALTSAPGSDLPLYRVGGRFVRFRLSELLAWAQRRDGGATPLEAEATGRG